MKKMSKKLPLVASKLTERDISALKSIYDLRCLTANQIYQLHYSTNKNNALVSDSYSKRKIKLFLELNVIEEVCYKNNKYAYFLTSLGVDLIRVVYNLPNNILDSQRKVVSRGYLRPSELKINTKLITHQLYLNQFFIDFLKLRATSFKYEDAKHSRFLKDVAPDAFLVTGDIQFFIEMDLGTESKKLLTDKWRHYRTFLNSYDFSYAERKIIVLFIIENTPNIEKRKDLVRYSIYEEILDLVGKDFDIYVGSKEEILNLLKNKFLPKEQSSDLDTKYDILSLLSSHQNLQIKPAYTLCNSFDEAENFTYFARYTNENNNEITHFFIDEHYYSPLSTFNKIADFEQTFNLFYNIFATDIRLLFIVDSEQNIFDELSTLNLIDTNVFFTTTERLSQLPFEEALFQIDRSGNLYSFKNSLSNRIFIKNLKD